MQKSQIKEKLKSAIQIYKKTKDPRVSEVDSILVKCSMTSETLGSLVFLYI